MKLRRSWPQRLLIFFNVLTVLAALGLAWLLDASWEKTASVNRVELAGALTPASPSTPGSRVLNILLVGSDSSVGLDPDNPVTAGRVGERNSDVIIVAHLDERDGTASLLSLPRDLWVPIAGSNREGKLNSAFAVGGPATLIETIEGGFGIPINYYVNIDFAGFEGLVDAVGSVDVFFDAPARDWNATYQQSQTGFEMSHVGCQSLDPPTALAYVRSRYYQTQDGDGRWVTDPTGDLGRIRRQQDFLQRLMQRAIDLGARNPFVLSDLIDTGLANVSIDSELTPQVLLDIGRAYASFEPGSLDTYSFPAIFGEVGASSVLFPLWDEAAPILSLFQGARADAPSTVRVKVVHDSAPELAEEMIASLVAAGFDVPGASEADIEPGLVVRHGVDGAQAASIVARALAAAYTDSVIIQEEVSGLLGRDIVVAVGVSSVGSEVPDLTVLSNDGPSATVNAGPSTPTTSPPPSTRSGDSSTTVVGETVTGEGPTPTDSCG